MEIYYHLLSVFLLWFCKCSHCPTMIPGYLCWSCWNAVFSRQARSQLAEGELWGDFMNTFLQFWTSPFKNSSGHSLLWSDPGFYSPPAIVLNSGIAHSHLQTSKDLLEWKQEEGEKQKTSQRTGVACHDLQGPPAEWPSSYLKSPSRNDGAMSKRR